MAKVLLGVSGSVAATRTPSLYRELKAAGHEVKVVATAASLYFFDPNALDPHDQSNPVRNREVVFLDEDEWPGSASGRRYSRDEPVLHIDLRRWADVFVLAPLDANTLAKLASGICDNCLTCVWRAWDPTKPVILAPAMNTLMWNHPLTYRNLKQVSEILIPEINFFLTDSEALIEWCNRQPGTLRIVAPVTKQLACGDVGVGAMAEVDAIVKCVRTVENRHGG